MLWLRSTVVVLQKEAFRIDAMQINASFCLHLIYLNLKLGSLVSFTDFMCSNSRLEDDRSDSCFRPSVQSCLGLNKCDYSV